MAGFFGMFDYTKPGKGVRKDEPDKTGIALYFEILFKRFWKLVSLNLIYLVASIPAIVIAWFVSTFFVTWSAAMVKLNLEEVGASLSILSILFVIVLIQILGSGPATAAMQYVIRKYVNDTHSWVWSDFFDNLKSNFKQGTAVYLINVIVTVLAIFGFFFYSFVMKGTIAIFLRTFLLVAIAIFAMMQTYVYQLMAGFELKVKHIYKNALLLTLAKLPWNILVAAVSFLIMYLVYYAGIRVVLAGVLILGMLYFSLLSFTQVFMTNNVVKKYILEPMLANNGAQQEAQEESDFEDVG